MESSNLCLKPTLPGNSHGNCKLYNTRHLNSDEEAVTLLHPGSKLLALQKQQFLAIAMATVSHITRDILTPMKKQ